MTPKTRREFLLESSAAFLLASAGLRAKSVDEAAAAEQSWTDLSRSFVVDRQYVSLNSAGVSCLPRPVLEAVETLLREPEALPAWNIFRYGPRLEPIRQDLAGLFGCDAEEIAIMRNATEALQAVLLGVPLQRGDEVLTTTLDYYSMLDALEQRRQREGIVVRKIRVPVPAHTEDELLSVFADGITARTKLILVSHPVNLTGQHFPVARICDLAHARGIEVIVDAAQSFGQFEVTAGSLKCDYMGASLHKWLMGPKGTGLLYIKREKIGKIWPLIASGSQRKSDDIRKFEAVGTSPMTALGLAEALHFHRAIGSERIAARLRFLTGRWAAHFQHDDRFEFRTSFAPGMSNGLAVVHLKGTSSFDVWEHLFHKEKILTFNVARRTEEFHGIRVSPGICNTVDEIDRFVATMKRLAERPPRAA